MDSVKQLFDLQSVDLEIDSRKKRLAKIEAELQADKTLRAAKKELAASQAAQRTIETAQKSIEEDVGSTRTRIASLEAHMYGDQAGGPRELQSITVEIEHLKQRQKDLEEKALAAMQKVEEARKSSSTQQAATMAAEEKFRSTQGHLLQEKARIETELPLWEAKRKQSASTVPPPALKVYEHLRAGKAGIAVAKVDRGVCGGCRITLPMILVQKARASKQFAYCSSCSRLLYVA